MKIEQSAFKETPNLDTNKTADFEANVFSGRVYLRIPTKNGELFSVDYQSDKRWNGERQLNVGADEQLLPAKGFHAAINPYRPRASADSRAPVDIHQVLKGQVPLLRKAVEAGIQELQKERAANPSTLLDQKLALAVEMLTAI